MVNNLRKLIQISRKEYYIRRYMTDNYAKNLQTQDGLLQALQWHIDHGADEVLVDKPVDRTATPDIADIIAKAAAEAEPEIMGAATAIVEAQKLAAACQTLEELKKAIMDFEGLSIKNTATNVVFADGDSKAPIMLIGDAPEAEEDIQGKPFVGEAGQLLDKILMSIGLSRDSQDINASVYISNVINWRPPGNRTPSQAEQSISLAFIERHIALAQPKMLIFCGGVAAKTLLKRSDTISKLRGSFHDYPVGDTVIPAMATYHPTYLLKTPSQKKAVWADMQMFQAKMKEIIA